jgi:hypothetical protein
MAPLLKLKFDKRKKARAPWGARAFDQISE